MPSVLLSLSVWLLLSALCAVIVARARYVADLSAFLPRSPSASQQLLVQQLQDGLASRLILIGFEGADGVTRAKLSRSLAAALRARPEFVSVNNGETGRASSAIAVSYSIIATFSVAR